MRREVAVGIENAVKDIIGVECEINVSEVTKNNGVVETGVTIREAGEPAASVIYIDHLLEKWRDGFGTFHSIAKYVVGEYEYCKNEKERYSEVARKMSKEYVLQNVVYKLINRERNMKLFESMPHKDLLDYSAVYRVMVDNGQASFAVTNSIIEAYGISREELDVAARKNTPEMFDFKISTMGQTLAELADIPEYADSAEPQMYVLTNSTKVYGATVLLYGEYFEALAACLGDDLYVIPSSVHEVLVVPESMVDDCESLNQMIRDVNEGVVDEADILGDRALRYFKGERKLAIA